MGTEESAWPSIWTFRAQFLALLFSGASVVAPASAGCAHAIDQNQARQSIVILNREAILSYKKEDFEAAAESLTKALKVARDGSEKEVATNGQFDSPSLIEIREMTAYPDLDPVCPDDCPNRYRPYLR